jgi:hypothetical protein
MSDVNKSSGFFLKVTTGLKLISYAMVCKRCSGSWTYMTAILVSRKPRKRHGHRCECGGLAMGKLIP